MSRHAYRPSAKPVDPLAVASAAIRELGHVPLRASYAYECWVCDLYGSIDRDGKHCGPIFKEKCK